MKKTILMILALTLLGSVVLNAQKAKVPLTNSCTVNDSLPVIRDTITKSPISWVKVETEKGEKFWIPLFTPEDWGRIEESYTIVKTKLKKGVSDSLRKILIEVTKEIIIATLKAIFTKAQDAVFDGSSP